MQRKNYVKRNTVAPSFQLFLYRQNQSWGQTHPLSLITKRQMMTTLTGLMLNQINPK